MTSTSNPVHSVSVLGVKVHMVQMPEVIDRFEHWIEQRDGVKCVVATGMHGVMEARRDPGFKALLNSVDLLVPDGISLVWIGRLRGLKLKSRVSGADLMWKFLKVAEQKGYRNFFYGDTENTLSAMAAKLKESFPHLKIAGFHSPPFRELSQDEQDGDVAMLNDSGADVIWVGLGLPKQERWMIEFQDRLAAPVIVGVGASFKFISGQVPRAPSKVGQMGLEWLWRFIQEPKRLWRRVLIDGPRFVCHVLLELTGLRKYD